MIKEVMVCDVFSFEGSLQIEQKWWWWNVRPPASVVWPWWYLRGADCPRLSRHETIAWRWWRWSWCENKKYCKCDINFWDLQIDHDFSSGPLEIFWRSSNKGMFKHIKSCWNPSVCTLGMLSREKNGIMWEKFPSGGPPPPVWERPVLQNKIMVYFSF